MAKAHIEYPGETKQTLPSLLCLGNLASLPERDRLNCVEFWSEITWLSHPGDGDVTQWTGERGLGRFPSPIHLMILLSTTILVCSLLDSFFAGAAVLEVGNKPAPTTQAHRLQIMFQNTLFRWKLSDRW